LQFGFGYDFSNHTKGFRWAVTTPMQTSEGRRGNKEKWNVMNSPLDVGLKWSADVSLPELSGCVVPTRVFHIITSWDASSLLEGRLPSSFAVLKAVSSVCNRGAYSESRFCLVNVHDYFGVWFVHDVRKRCHFVSAHSADVEPEIESGQKIWLKPVLYLLT
jgi:hypothetical protein